MGIHVFILSDPLAMLFFARWTLNLCIETANKMFYGQSSFNSADLVEADTMAVCAYFCYFFMIAYKFRQAKAIVQRIVSIWFVNLLRQSQSRPVDPRF